MNLTLIQAKLESLSVLENMARFYLYEMSRYCGFRFEEYSWPEEKLIHLHHFRQYLSENDRKALFIVIDNELAGFMLLRKSGIKTDIDWKISEFFILPKFRGKAIGKKAAFQIFDKLPGTWEISILPENTGALQFWRHVISSYSNNAYTEESLTIDYPSYNPKRIVLTFLSHP